MRRMSLLAAIIIAIGMAGSCSDTAAPSDPVDPFRITQPQPVSGTAPLWVIFGTNGTGMGDADADTVIWNFGDGTVDTFAYNIDPPDGGAKHFYFEEGKYTVSVVAIVGDRRYTDIKPGLVTITSTVERPVINLDISEAPATDGAQEFFEYDLAVTIENMVPEERFIFTFTYDVHNLEYTHMTIPNTELYECETGYTGGEEFLSFGNYNYGADTGTIPGWSDGPKEMTHLNFDPGISFYHQAITSLDHMTRLDSWGNNEFHPWDCSGDVAIYHFKSTDRSVSYSNTFKWMWTSFDEREGVVLKINGEVVKPLGRPGKKASP